MPKDIPVWVGLVAGVLYILEFAVVRIVKPLGKRLRGGPSWHFLSVPRVGAAVTLVALVALLFVDVQNLKVALAATAVAGFVVGNVVEFRAWRSHKPRQNVIDPAAVPSFSDLVMLARQFSETSAAIYAFLKKRATRSDEHKVVAEYGEEFDAKVVNLCLDLIAFGVSDAERLKTAMTPPTSVSDIRWIARILAVTGKGFGPDLERYGESQGPGRLYTPKGRMRGRSHASNLRWTPLGTSQSNWQLRWQSPTPRTLN